MATSERRAGWCITAEIDLERLARGYRHRPTQPHASRNAAAAAAHLGRGDRALDVGGGRGDHAVVWAERGVEAVVLDPASGMITAAAAQPGVRAVIGRAQELPFRSRTFGLVYFHLSIHYGDVARAIEEAARVLADRGRIEIWTLGPRHHPSSNLSRWFPSVAALDAQRFPHPETIAGHLTSLGLEVTIRPRPEPVARPAGEWVRSVRAGFVSTLQLLDADEIEAGLAEFQRQHPDPDQLFTYVLDYDQIVAVPRPLP